MRSESLHASFSTFIFNHKIATMSIFFFQKMNKLLTIEIWRDAATQVFFSLGIGFGTIFMYSGYNKANFKCKTAALYYGVIDTTVGICSCIIVFSLRGFQAHFKDSECNSEKMRELNQTSSVNIDYHVCNDSFLSKPVCKYSLNSHNLKKTCIDHA